MLIDLHLHEKQHSADSQLDVKDIVRQAKIRGLDAIGITDHDSIGLFPQAERLSQEMNFPIFVGAEILTYEGDLLIYGVDHIPEHKMHAQELIDWTEKRGGISIAAHPYRENGRALGDTMFSLKGLSGVEALNGSTPMPLNDRACHAAFDLKLPLLGCSDAHRQEKVGIFATKFSQKISHVQDLVREIRAGRTNPVYSYQNTYHSLDLESMKELAV